MHLLNITSHYSLIRKLKRKGIPRFQSLTAESSFYLEEEGGLKKKRRNEISVPSSYKRRTTNNANSQ